MSRRIVITGATGQIGRPLSRWLIEMGYDVVVLSRRPDAAANIVPGAVDYIAWEPGAGGAWEASVDGAYGVIALAGAPFFRRWKSRREFERVAVDGRLVANRGLVDAMRAAANRPSMFVTASAVGFYGFTDSDETVLRTPRAGPTGGHAGADAWEAAARSADGLGVRTVCMRTGIVFSADNGMAAQMAPQYRKGWGAIVLPGSQWLPWIHIADEVGLFLLAIEDERVAGALNASAPEPVRFREFAQTMGTVLGRRSRASSPRCATSLGRPHRRECACLYVDAPAWHVHLRTLAA